MDLHVKQPSGSCSTISQAATCGLTPEDGNNFVTRLLEDFPDVVNEGRSLLAAIHNAEHHIQTTGHQWPPEFGG